MNSDLADVGAIIMQTMSVQRTIFENLGCICILHTFHAYSVFINDGLCWFIIHFLEYGCLCISDTSIIFCAQFPFRPYEPILDFADKIRIACSVKFMV